MNEVERMRVMPGAVVQIEPGYDDRNGHRWFGGCFMVVTEVRSWGVQGYVTVPGEDGDAYYRVPWENVEYIGEAVWVVGGDDAPETRGEVPEV